MRKTWIITDNLCIFVTINTYLQGKISSKRFKIGQINVPNYCIEGPRKIKKKKTGTWKANTSISNHTCLAK